MVKQPPIQPQRNSALPYEIVGGVLVVLVAIAIGTWPATRKSSTITAARQISTANQPTVPGSFENFAGTITSISDSKIKVIFRGFLNNGQTYTKEYGVTVAGTTVITKTAAANQVASETSTTSSALAVGQTIIVIGTGNLADISEFTATKIIIQSS